MTALSRTREELARVECLCRDPEQGPCLFHVQFYPGRGRRMGWSLALPGAFITGNSRSYKRAVKAIRRAFKEAHSNGEAF